MLEPGVERPRPAALIELEVVVLRKVAPPKPLIYQVLSIQPCAAAGPPSSPANAAPANAKRQYPAIVSIPRSDRRPNCASAIKLDRRRALSSGLLARGASAARSRAGVAFPRHPRNAVTSISIFISGSFSPATTIVAAGRTSPSASRNAGATSKRRPGR